MVVLPSASNLTYHSSVFLSLFLLLKYPKYEMKGSYKHVKCLQTGKIKGDSQSGTSLFKDLSVSLRSLW